MKVAIIGCGGIGRAHAQAFKKIEGVEIVAFVDICVGSAERMAEAFGGRAYKDIGELPGGLDGVSIATPPFSHYKIAKELLGGGLGVFCEKPLTMDPKEARELVELSERAGCPLMVGFKMRFEPIFQRARELISEIGPIYGVSTAKIQPYRPKPIVDWVPEVGAMYELSVHEFDLVHWIGGLSPKWIYADLRYDLGWEREDKFFLQVDYQEGVRGQLMGAYSEKAKFFYRDLAITFIGENGYMRIERPDRIALHMDKFRVEEIDGRSVNTFVDELSNFVDVVTKGAEQLIETEVGPITTLMVEAANLSFKRGAKVELTELG